VFNKDTNRVILRNLMDNGIRDADGQLPGKSIVFARNIDHARLLAELFDEMYPQFAGKFCRVIHSQEPRAEDLIDDFKGKAEPRIAISVDMLDTGIDVPEVVNLVFAKPVKSKVKFWQMIGRGTRLCKDLFGPGKDKTEFLIFDHWGNFAYHDLNAEEVEPKVPKPADSAPLRGPHRTRRPCIGPIGHPRLRYAGHPDPARCGRTARRWYFGP
jgi:type I restriction enzyme R subunit